MNTKNTTEHAAQLWAPRVSLRQSPSDRAPFLASLGKNGPVAVLDLAFQRRIGEKPSKSPWEILHSPSGIVTPPYSCSLRLQVIHCIVPAELVLLLSSKYVASGMEFEYVSSQWGSTPFPLLPSPYETVKSLMENVRYTSWVQLIGMSCQPGGERIVGTYNHRDTKP